MWQLWLYSVRWGGAYAQTDVTSTYLTNADFEGSYSVQSNPKNDRAIYQPEGWTVTYTNGDQWDLSILNSNDLSSGSFSGIFTNLDTSTYGSNTYRIRFRWGSNEKFVVSHNVTRPAGNYRLTADVAGNAGNKLNLIAGSASSTDAVNDSQWKTISLDFTSDGTAIDLGISVPRGSTEQLCGFDNIKLYKITAIKTALNEAITTATNANATLNNSDLTAAIATAQAVADNTSATQDEVDAAVTTLNAAVTSASTIDGANVTYRITNNSFETGNLTGWDVYMASDTRAADNSNSTDPVSNADGSYVFNTWDSGTSNKYIKQTLTGLPTGYYVVTALFASDAGLSATLYAGDSKVTTSASSEGKGTFVEYSTPAAYVDNGTLEIGMTSTNWYKADNFRLTYRTVAAIAKPDYEEALAAAKDVDQTAPMNAEVLKALTDALTTYGNLADGSDLYSTASTALKTATANATASIAAYASAKTALDNRNKLYEDNNFITDEAYSTYYTDPMAKYEARTLTTDEAKAINNPYAISGWRDDANTNKFMGSAYGITDYNGVPYVNTWSTEGESDGSNFKVPFYEYWVADGSILGDKTLTTTKTGLTAGKVYKVSAWVRARLSNNQTAPVTGITMDAGGSSVAITGAQVGSSQLYLDNYTVYGTADSEGTLTVNFKVAGTNASWLSFQNLKYEEATVTALDESSDNTIADASDSYVTLNRSFSTEYYNSLVLPFSLTADQVTAAFGEGTTVYSYSNTDGDNVNFTTSTTGIAANTPVLIKTATTSTSFAFSNVNLVKATPTAAGINWNFVGSYNAKTVIPVGAYEMYNNNLYKSDGTSSYFIKGFRAYIAPVTTTAAKPALTIDGVVTSIDKVITNIDKEGNLYNLAGQRVSKNTKGIVIKNGKKVINK